MKCQICGAEIDNDIVGLDEWYSCPHCHTSMLGFTDDMLYYGINELLTDVKLIERRLDSLLGRLCRKNQG